MSCITVNIKKVNDSLNASCKNIGGINNIKISLIDIIDIKVKTEKIGEDLMINIINISPVINVTYGITCSISNIKVIKFNHANLVWEGDLNKEGVILYNTLISTDDWSLEEIEIEELL